MIYKFSTIFLLNCISLFCFAQADSGNAITFSGYAEMYYSFDFSNPPNHQKADYIYSHKRTNEINANLILAKAAYNKNNIRANVAVMAGNYAQYNLSSEPTWAQFINEANIGVKLSNKKNIWLDVGIMPSHIGFESAISADCWTLTRSILAENTPYYETGARLSYTNNKNNFSGNILLLNGWQKIQRPDYIQNPSVGLQFIYTPSEKFLINYSNFIGSDKPDSLHALRVYHNLYAQFQASKNISFTTGFDLGSDKYNNTNYGIWYSPVVIVKHLINSKNKIAYRIEYYNDAHQTMIHLNTNYAFKTLGISTNYDYNIKNNLLFRIEAKVYHSSNAIFYNNKNNNISITSSLSIKI